MAENDSHSQGQGKHLSLEDVIDVRKWQGILDNFSEITEINLRTINNECRQITKSRKELEFCNKLINAVKQKDKFCGPCLPTFLGGKGIVDKNLCFTCDAGLYNSATPLKSDDEKTWGYIIAGPVILVRRKPKEEYSWLAEKLNVPLDALWNALFEIKVISFHEIQSILRFLQEIAAYAIETAYRKFIKELPGRLSIYNSARLKRFLDILLDMAFELTGADTGSIMLLNKKKGELAISSSKGINEEVAKHARVALGSSISGVAAAEKESFLIDDNFKDSRVKSYLNKPQLGSSMVIPFEIEKRVNGVLNLAALRSSPVRFTPGNLNEVNRILDLTARVI